MGSPIVPPLIPTSHKLQTKVNLFLKGGEGRWGGEKYRPVFQLGGKWLKKKKKTYLQEMTDSLTPLSTLYVFFPPTSSSSSSSFAVFIALWWCCWWWIVGCWMIPGFFRLEWGWGTCWRLRGGFAAGVINIKIYRDAITGWSEIGLMSPLGSLSGWTSAFSQSWRAFFSFFSVFSFFFSPLPEKTR